MDDQAAHLELYWGRAVAVHGTLTKLQPIPGFAEEGDAPVWREGSLKLWNEDKTVRFLTRQLPKDMPTGNDLNEPAEVIGFVFSLAGDSGKSPEPVIVARRVRWLKPELDPQTFAGVKDRTIGIPDAEYDAYYRTLLHAKLMEQTDLEKQAETFWNDRQKNLKHPRPLFVDMFKSFEEDPKLYRGQVVTLTGTLRELKKWDETTEDRFNDYGLETIYEGWIYNEDSQSNPTAVVFTENPDNIPTGSNLSLPVKVTGYVFKMYGYESRDKEHPLRVAPMLLAKTITERDITEPAPFPVGWVAGALALLCLGIALFVWSANKNDKQFREEITQKDANEEPPRFDDLSVE
jgi:hypothetical protein